MRPYGPAGGGAEVGIESPVPSGAPSGGAGGALVGSGALDGALVGMGFWISVGADPGAPEELPFGPPSEGGTYFFHTTGRSVGSGVNVIVGVLVGVISSRSIVAVGLGRGDGIADVINACNDIAGEVCAGEDIGGEDFDVEGCVFVG